MIVILVVQDRVGAVTVFIRCQPGDPRVNIQNDKRKAKIYQVKQVLAAIDKLEELKNVR